MTSAAPPSEQASGGPLVIIYKDGRALWKNDAAQRCAEHDDELWREIGTQLCGQPRRISFRGHNYEGLKLPLEDWEAVILLRCKETVHGTLVEDDFHEIFNNSFDGIFVADRYGRTLLVNEGCERNYDLAASEMIGRHVSELEANGFIKPVIAARVIASKQRETALQHTHKGKTIMATGIPLFDERGEVRRVIINSRDMTELMRLQAELADAQDNLARAQREVANLRQDQLKLNGVILQSAAMQQTARLALRVAKSDATVLLTGESGVGKEVFARLIHKESQRADAPFIKINCGAIPRELLESELFGYEGGAFTGALRKGKPGLIELADRGTLFLDEIGELSLDMQVKLLHVLQDRVLVRVGGTEQIRIDIRIVAATNRNLEELVEAKAFRSDLFYRLNVVPIEIPPLRQRREDILPLLHQCLSTFNAQYGTKRRFSPGLMSDLIEYRWPGNVRELRNIVERLVVTAIEDTIGRTDLPSQFAARTAAPTEAGLDERLRAYERMIIHQAIEQFGSTRAAARHLGISQSSVVRKLKSAREEKTRDGLG